MAEDRKDQSTKLTFREKVALDREIKRREEHEATDQFRRAFAPLDNMDFSLSPKPETPLGKVFAKIPGAPVTASHGNPYYSEGRLAYIGGSNLNSLESRKPFFVIDSTGIKPNKEVVPFVFDPKINESQRFKEAEKHTDGDSAIFALCAISAPTPDKQAHLYSAVANTIVKMHTDNPELLIDWMAKQLEAQGLSNTSSFDVFSSFDFSQRDGKVVQRPINEVLVSFPPEDFEKIWKARIEELGKLGSKDEFVPHQIRWIEFLSHSVYIPELLSRVEGYSF